MSELERNEFVELLLKRVADKFPLVDINRNPEGFAVLINGQLAPLENLYRMAALQPGEAGHQIDRWIVEILRFSEGTPDQSAGIEQLKERIFPMVLAWGDLKVHPGILFQPLLEGLIVGYVVDSEQTVAYVSREHLGRWKMTVDDLHALALENLVRKSEAISAHAAQDETGRVNLVLFQTMDGYDATRILLPTLHDRLAKMLGSPFAAAVPNRDILLCFRNDEETILPIRAQVSADYRRMPHQVTDRLLLVTADGIAMRA